MCKLFPAILDTFMPTWSTKTFHNLDTVIGHNHTQYQKKNLYICKCKEYQYKGGSLRYLVESISLKVLQQYTISLVWDIKPNIWFNFCIASFVWRMNLITQLVHFKITYLSSKLKFYWSVNKCLKYFNYNPKRKK